MPLGGCAALRRRRLPVERQQLGADGDVAQGFLQIMAGGIGKGLQIRIGTAEFLIGALEFVLYPPRLLEEPGIVHGDGGLRGNQRQSPRAAGEPAGSTVTEEQAAQTSPEREMTGAAR